MRLWHYEILPYLPRQQLLAQWRELNVIFKKEQKHILWNYVYEYEPIRLSIYSYQVIAEMKRRGYKISSYANMFKYFESKGVNLYTDIDSIQENPFPEHHTNQYLLQCFFNLQEKFNRGQDCQDYMEKLVIFITGKFPERRLYDLIMFEK